MAYSEYQALIDKLRCLSWQVDLAPCQVACPLGIDIEGYVAAIAQGNWKQSLEIIRARCPLPVACAYACHHPCEAECKRANTDEPIAIRELKRFVVDCEREQKLELTPFEKTRPEKIAIIGSGPAGLTAAYGLAKERYPVTVYEALPMAGGMLATGIPEFVLKQELVQAEIDNIRALGVDIKTNSPIEGNEAINALFQQGNKAVLLAIGAQQSVELSIPGINLDGVIYALPLLRKAKLGEKVSLQGRGVVIGGGNVAIDAAGLALRSGASEVHLVCIEPEENMPAFEWDVRRAEFEGVNIHNSLFPQEFCSRDGSKVSQVALCRVAHSELDSEGRITWTLNEGPDAKSSMDVDWVIVAIGQKVDLSGISDSGKPKVSRKGTITVDPDTLATGMPGVFAAGDVVTNPGTLVESMAAGWKAAGSIHNYLQGQDLKPNVEAKPVNTGVDMLPAGIVPAKRQQVPSLSAEESIQSFKKVELGFSKEQAIQEAMRCLRCRTCNRCIEETHCVGLSLAENTLKWSPYIEGNICAGCGRCARACPYNNIYLEPIC